MSKQLSPLEALKKIKDNMAYQIQLREDCVIVPEFDIVEKSLKALEIIKEKNVNVFQMKRLFKSGFTYEDYVKLWNTDIERHLYTNSNILYSLFKLTQEEFDLLKEELGK